MFFDENVVKYITILEKLLCSNEEMYKCCDKHSCLTSVIEFV